MLQMVLSFCLITLPIFIFDKANAQATVQMPAAKMISRITFKTVIWQWRIDQRQIGQLSRFAEFYF